LDKYKKLKDKYNLLWGKLANKLKFNGFLFISLLKRLHKKTTIAYLIPIIFSFPGKQAIVVLS
jgi:hypothetical protein